MPPPIRDIGLLSAAASRPPTSAFGADAYPDLWTKAAALLQSIVKDHPLVDGNKRHGWLATAVVLHLNGLPAEPADNSTVYDLVMAVAGGDAEVAEIAQALQEFVDGH
jgi:death-on-curing protein